MRNISLALLLSFGSLGAIYEDQDNTDYCFYHNAPDAQDEIDFESRKFFRGSSRSVTANRMWAADQYDLTLYKSAKHKEAGARAFQLAQEKCWYLPERSQKENCNHFFTQACIYASNSNPWSKSAMMVGTFLFDYGYDALEEFSEIRTLIRWSQYHYEMAEFYDSMITQPWRH